MHTVVLAFVATLTASWWFKRNVANSPVPTPSAHLHAVPGMDRPGAASARKGANVQRMPLALVQESSNDDPSPSLRLENGTAVGGKVRNLPRAKSIIRSAADFSSSKAKLPPLS